MEAGQATPEEGGAGRGGVCVWGGGGGVKMPEDLQIQQ